MIFATDLDNTMIFSHRLIEDFESEPYCVEYYNGRAISYMTVTAIEKLKKLMETIYVIPVTTRSIAQFNRVEIFSKAEYAVVDNGGTILHNGEVYAEWEEYIGSILCKYNFEEICQIFKQLPNIAISPKVIDGKFLFTKSDDIDLCTKILKNEIDTKMWKLSFQGKKIYAIPNEITKGSALKFINEELIKEDQVVIAAGDSNLDLSMLEYAENAIIPWGCKLFSHNKKFIEIGNSIVVSDAILDYVTNLSI